MQTLSKFAIALSVSAALTSCVAISEQTREEQQYRSVDWEHRYRDYRRRCQQAGGHMLIRSVSRIARAGLPRRSDRYRCSLGVGPVPRD